MFIYFFNVIFRDFDFIFICSADCVVLVLCRIAHSARPLYNKAVEVVNTANSFGECNVEYTCEFFGV